MSKNKKRNKNKQENNQKKEIGKQKINKENLIEIKLASIKELLAVFILSFIIFGLLRIIPDIGDFKLTLLINNIISEHKAPVTIATIASIFVIPAVIIEHCSLKKCIKFLNCLNYFFIKIFNFTSSLILVYLGSFMVDIICNSDYGKLKFTFNKYQPEHLMFFFLILIMAIYSKCKPFKYILILLYIMFFGFVICNLYTRFHLPINPLH